MGEHDRRFVVRGEMRIERRRRGGGAGGSAPNVVLSASSACSRVKSPNMSTSIGPCASSGSTPGGNQRG
jgi:hypothetical protein